MHKTARNGVAARATDLDPLRRSLLATRSTIKIIIRFFKTRNPSYLLKYGVPRHPEVADHQAFAHKKICGYFVVFNCIILPSVEAPKKRVRERKSLVLGGLWYNLSLVKERSYRPRRTIGGGAIQGYFGRESGVTRASDTLVPLRL